MAHTVTQSTFVAPCTYLNNARLPSLDRCVSPAYPNFLLNVLQETAGKTGFDSGLVPTPAGSEVSSLFQTVEKHFVSQFDAFSFVIPAQFKTMAIQVDSTEPLWFFCKPHCGKGMVGSSCVLSCFEFWSLALPDLIRFRSVCLTVNAVESSPKNFAVYQQAAVHLNISIVLVNVS